jgi:hypothetical protein
MSTSVTDATDAGSSRAARSATRPPSEWPTRTSGRATSSSRAVASTSAASVVESAPGGSGGDAP